MPNQLNAVITADQQSSLTPDEVFQQLKDGNAVYQQSESLSMETASSREATTGGQYPKAFVLSCIDSRVPVETVFNQGIGSLFVGRVAGNIVDGDQLGSMEFATKVAGAKLVVVLGHESCGAIKGACDCVELGNLTGLVNRIQPAVTEAKPNHTDQSSGNKAFVDEVTEINVKHTIETIRSKSEILKELEDSGAIKIVGGVYSLGSGKVDWLD